MQRMRNVSGINYPESRSGLVVESGNWEPPVSTKCLCFLKSHPSRNGDPARYGGIMGE